jgi:hypothetical protein
MKKFAAKFAAAGNLEETAAGSARGSAASERQCPKLVGRGNLSPGFRCLREESEPFAKLLDLPRRGGAGKRDLFPDHAAPAAGCAAPQLSFTARPRPAGRFLDLSGALRTYIFPVSFPAWQASERATPIAQRLSNRLDSASGNAPGQPEKCTFGSMKAAENACQLPLNRA